MKTPSWLLTVFLLLLSCALLVGCGAGGTPALFSAPASPTVEPTQPPSATPLPPTPTETPNPPTATFTATPTLSPSKTPTPSLTPTETPPPPTPSGDQAVYIYLIETGTGGPIACGDSLIKINTGLWRTGDIEADIAAALRSTLVKSKYIAGLYNPAYLSNMQVTGVKYNPDSGAATVDLAGTYVRSGDRCDDGRVHDQIWTAIRQFGIKGSPLVRLNGNLLGDILSTAPGRESPKHKQP